MPHAGSTLTVPAPRGFDLKKTVCSYGYFLLAPNFWDVKRRVLYRALRLRNGRLVKCVVRQRKSDLLVLCDRNVPRGDQALIKGQVSRMLRLDEDVKAWRKAHPDASRRGFLRMFRAPTLFEDIVKTITSCNVTWKNTTTMNRLMVEHVGHGGFPTPAQLADFGEDNLKARCKVGYRADRIIRLAKGFEDGTHDPAWFEDPARSADELFAAFKAIHGLGPYAAGNVCHLIGCYEHLAIDSETYRHFCLHYDVKRPKTPAGYQRLHRRIEKHYGAFAPFQFKAYWYELWRDYESRYGPAWTWDRDTTGQNFTAAVLNSADA